MVFRLNTFDFVRRLWKVTAFLGELALLESLIFDGLREGNVFVFELSLFSTTLISSCTEITDVDMSQFPTHTRRWQSTQY